MLVQKKTKSKTDSVFDLNKEFIDLSYKTSIYIEVILSEY